MFADALASEGVTVRELYQNAASVLAAGDVLVLHWPDEFFYARSLSRRFRGMRSLTALLIAKYVQRKRIIWVGHNLVPHQRGARVSRIRLPVFLRAVDGLIFLSRASQSLFCETYPQLAAVPSIVVPHGHYRSRERSLPSVRDVAGPRPVRLAFMGQVKRYKAPDIVARLVASLSPDRCELVIAGQCKDPDLGSELTTIAAGVSNVDIQLGYLEDAALEALIDGADAVILPYRDILNSGSALMALSRFRPVIAPRLGSLVDLQNEVGEAWVWLYEGDLTTEKLAAALDWARQPRDPRGPDLSRQEWALIGSRITAYLRQIVAR